MDQEVGGSIPPSCTKQMSKQKKLKPELASGFRDRKGNELILKDRLIEIIKRNFQLLNHLTLPFILILSSFVLV